MNMKTLVRKTLTLLFAFMAFAATANASHDTPITVSQLPQTAQTMLKNYFKNKKVALATMEKGVFDRSYEVIFIDGDKVEFDRSGNWKEIRRKTSAVPNSLIPSKITAYVRANYPNAKVVEIERDGKEYDVKLSNRIELTFNKKFKLIDIDN